MPDKRNVVFQIWRDPSNRENDVGNLKDLFIDYKKNLKEENGPYFFAYFEYQGNPNDIISTDIPHYRS